MWTKFKNWLKSIFGKKDDAWNPGTASGQSVPRSSDPPVAPVYGTIIESTTAGFLYQLAPPDGLVDPVYWIERKQWFSRKEVAHVRAVPQGDPGAIVSNTGDSGERRLNYGHPLGFRAQSVPDSRIFYFVAEKAALEIATAMIPGGVGRMGPTGVKLKDAVGNVITGDKSISDLTNVRAQVFPGQMYNIEVTLEAGGAVSVVIR